MKKDKITYKDAGVDIDAGSSFVENIKPFVKSTFDENVLGNIGSFAGAYALPKGYKEPVILGATDGVGTKLKLAIESNRYDSIGIDLVAMCVNDLICNYATPSFFLDYYATAKLNTDVATKVVKGISTGCIEAECSLIGGETAEMPGMYQKDDFDLAGFAVGIAERADLDRVSRVKDNDILIAFPSSGIHSNGYSLVRKLFFEQLNMKFDDKIDGKKLIDTLLEPTCIYVKTFKKIKDSVHAFAHITGGGIVENLPRVLPEDLEAIVYKEKIKTLPIFEFMKNYIDEDEMFRTFNMGVGLIACVSSLEVDKVLSLTDGYVIGELKKGDGVIKLV